MTYLRTVMEDTLNTAIHSVFTSVTMQWTDILGQWPVVNVTTIAIQVTMQLANYIRN